MAAQDANDVASAHLRRGLRLCVFKGFAVIYNQDAFHKCSNTSRAHLPHPHERISAGGDESFALDGETHILNRTAMTALAVAYFLDDVVSRALVQQDNAIGSAAGAWV